MHFCIGTLLLISFDYLGLGRMTHKQSLQAWNFNANLCHFFSQTGKFADDQIISKSLSENFRKAF